ncbi:MAG: DegT/DnrJ/EryC1/StrS family aminotransferase [Nitrosopumilus sp.]|nr:DegT/DnrJ/EryC1/StrS family aminotransferase [Nitrosopumilus sp.]
MEKIPVFIPNIGEDTKLHVNDALDIGWLGMGSTTMEFEERISKFLELKNRYVVTTNTGTSALHIALKLADIGPGDEVITPSFNYVADHQAIKMTGAKVVMCDISDENLGIDCKKAEELITEKTKAIIPLHFAGIPCNQKEVFELAKKYKLRIIEDAMHAFGTSIDNKKIGSYGDITCFSFDPVKIITSIDGGCVIVNTKEEVEKLHRLRLLGVDKDTTERYKNKRAWDYDVLGEGYRYHLTNIMASIGNSQIKKIDEFIVSRQKVCQKYNKAFQNISEIKIPKTNFSNVSPFIYSLRILNGKREDLIKHLQSLDIDVGIHFIPVHKHKFFQNSKRGDMAITEKVVKQVLTLPLHSNMKDEFVNRIINGVTSFFNNLKKD